MSSESPSERIHRLFFAFRLRLRLLLHRFNMTTSSMKNGMLLVFVFAIILISLIIFIISPLLHSDFTQEEIVAPLFQFTRRHHIPLLSSSVSPPDPFNNDDDADENGVPFLPPLHSTSTKQKTAVKICEHGVPIETCSHGEDNIHHYSEEDEQKKKSENERKPFSCDAEEEGGTNSFVATTTVSEGIDHPHNILERIVQRSKKCQDLDFKFQSVAEWETFCASAPLQTCYKPLCYSPLVVRRNNDNSSSSFSSSSFDFEKSTSLDSPPCEPNPFYFPAKKKSKRKDSISQKYTVDEFSCDHKKSDREKYFDRGENEKKNAKEDPLYKFKKHTSWLFDKWYDWGGECVGKSNNNENKNNKNKNNQDDDHDNLILEGKHSMKDGLYRLNNVCLRPAGGITGYFPSNESFESRLHHFRGTDDVAFATHQAFFNVQRWIRGTEHHHRLSKPADCYLDTKVVLLALDFRSENPGHSFYRAGFTLRTIEAAFGKEAVFADDEQQQAQDNNENMQIKNNNKKNKNKVTVGYLRMGNVPYEARTLLATKKKVMYNNGMRYFYDILGSSWFSIFGQDYPLGHGTSNEEEVLGFKSTLFDDEISGESSMACFKEVVIAQNSLLHGKFVRNDPDFQDQQKTVSYGLKRGNTTDFLADEFTPGAQTSFHIHGPRSPRDVETLDKLLKKRLLKCGGLPPARSTPRRSSPHIMFAVRSVYRRLTLQPYMISFLAHQIRHRFGPLATFEVVEHSALSFREIIQRFSNTDVLLGIYGAAFVWSVFMPPSSILWEIGTELSGYTYENGVQKNLGSEYGGSALIARQYHINTRDYFRLLRGPTGFSFQAPPAPLEQVDNLLPLNAVEFIMQKIHCLTTRTWNDKKNNKNSDSNNLCLSVPSCCDFDNQELGSVLDTAIGQYDLWHRQIMPMILRQRTLLHDVHNNGNFFFSPRLAAMVRDSSHRDAFVDATHHFSIPSSPEILRSVKIAVVEPCSLRTSFMAESSAYRQMFQRVEKIVVIENAMGKEFCSKYDTEEVKSKKEQVRKSFKDNAKVADYRFDRDGVIFCDYPCRSLAPFDLVIGDCFHDDEQDDDNDQHSSSCDVSFNILEDQRRQNHQLLPSATELYQKLVNGLFGTLVMFSHRRTDSPQAAGNKNKNEDPSVLLLHLLDPEISSTKQKSSSSSIDTVDRVFTARGPVQGRISPFHPLLHLSNQKKKNKQSQKKSKPQLLDEKTAFNLLLQQVSFSSLTVASGGNDGLALPSDMERNELSAPHYRELFFRCMQYSLYPDRLDLYVEYFDSPLSKKMLKWYYPKSAMKKNNHAGGDSCDTRS